MDPNRFDRFSKAIASRLTRRQMLGGLGAGGIAASLLGDFEASAADGKTICVYDFDGTIDVGPSSTLAATSAVGGTLTIAIGPNGAIDAGRLVTPGGDAWNVVGQATGRALSLRISVPNVGAFIAVGGGRHAIEACAEAIAGPASGPQRRDAGSWSATLVSSEKPAATTTTAVVATAPGAASTVASGDLSPAENEAEPATPSHDQESSTAGDCELECGEDTLGLDASTCVCLCAPGLTSCTYEIGSIPAKGGVIFKTAPITTPRGFCIDLSSDLSNCGACQHFCAYTDGVSDYACTAGVCSYECKPGYDACGGDQPCLIDLMSDAANCGACGAACAAGLSCVDGVCACDRDCGAGNSVDGDCNCVCAAGLTTCGTYCADTQTDPANCGGCGNVCLPAEHNCSKGACYGQFAP